MKNKVFLTIMGIIIYLIPIVIIVLVSNGEIRKYQTKKIEFVDSAYGEVFQVEQKDVSENIVINAVAVPNDVYVVRSNNTVWVVDEGEEIYKNQMIGFANNTAIKGEVNGIVKKIASNYLIIDTYKDIVWKTKIPKENLSYFDKELFDKDGNEIQICSISNRVDDGQVTVKFKLENVKGKCGEELKKLRLYTGNVFKNALTINKKCIVNKKGSYYVRIVDSHGIFLYEQQVGVGFENDKIICVTGLEEGEFCDGGFSEYIGSELE